MAGLRTGRRQEASFAVQDIVRRAASARLPLAVAGLVFAGLWAFTPVGSLVALLGFAAVAVALLSLSFALVPLRPSAAAAAAEPAAGPLAGYAAVADSLPDPCFLIDRAGGVLFENAAARTLFGGIGAGSPLTLLLRVPEVAEAVQQALASGIPTAVTFFERVPADRWFEARVGPLAEPGGGAPVRPPVFLMLLRDLTEAQRVERMRVDFVANASHELRTPLASLSGFIETLQGPARNDPEARERFLEVMAEQARRMSRLIDDLMSLSRIELKAHVRPETTVDLAPVLEHVADAMHPLAIESGVELAVDVRERPLAVVGDRDELAQVFQNLVHNAIKYGQSGKRVEVSAGRQECDGDKPARVWVAVRDFGPGIAAEHLPRLTERFYRVDTASSREKGGTGLGLAIVKHILNRHRGQLAIDSRPGEGAEFRILLDAAESGAVSGSPHRIGTDRRDISTT